jgi:hypothetical protein
LIAENWRLSRALSLIDGRACSELAFGNPKYVGVRSVENIRKLERRRLWRFLLLSVYIRSDTAQHQQGSPALLGRSRENTTIVLSASWRFATTLSVL